MRKEYKFSKWARQEEEPGKRREEQEKKDKIEEEKNEREKDKNEKEYLEKTAEVESLEEIESWIDENFERIKSKLKRKGFEIKDEDFLKTYDPDSLKIAYNSETYSGKVIDYLRDFNPEYRTSLRTALLALIDNKKKTNDFIDYLISKNKIVIKRFEL